MDFQQFLNGGSFDAHEYFGAHPMGGGVMFRVYAPRAEAVNIMGEFSTWQEQAMGRDANGVWENFCPHAHEGQMYKYIIYGKNGRAEHCDPYGFGMEMRPGNCSVVRSLDAYKLTDDKWMGSRTKCFDRPLNIYELHMGSWRKNGWQWYEYDRLADELIPWLKDMGYTHVEFMPLAEHPFDGSWGYQGLGYFAPTSRHGTAAQLMCLIDRLHNAGLGAILDFVPVHFAVDGFGLRDFDGQALYEHPGAKGRSEWGSRLFDHSRGQVQSFLQSAANYWLGTYHFDGLRMDAVSRLIFKRGDWQKGENAAGIDFIKKLNQGLQERHPTAMLIAEDSSAYPGVTRPVQQGGLGFDYKWDLSWSYNTLKYFSYANASRGKKGALISAAADYSHTERFILPLSHDECSRATGSIVTRLHGDLAQARLLYLLQMCLPGKKLSFMGNELGQRSQWQEDRALDWWLLGGGEHKDFCRFMAELNALYINKKALWASNGFQWLKCRSRNPCILGFSRPMGEDTLLVFLNFSDRAANMDPDVEGNVRLIMHTDWDIYGGGSKSVARRKIMKRLPAHSGAVYLCC